MRAELLEVNRKSSKSRGRSQREGREPVDEGRERSQQEREGDDGERKKTSCGSSSATSIRLRAVIPECCS